jgi:XTP/dITP diphosphohydrolase
VTASQRVLLATRNDAKLAELRRIVAALGVDVVGLADVPAYEEAPETGATFAENALVKARAAAAATGGPAIADDSGIESAALGGRPGVRSARFAGEHATDEENLAKLLREAPAGSAVAYVCVVAYVDGARERLFEGRCMGTLAAAPRGEGGFGYDPAFVPDDLRDGRTMAELAPEEKDAISHRGRAARLLLEWLGAAATGEPATASGG